MSQSLLIALKHASASFGLVMMSKDVSVNVHAGQVPLGENGIGKSTLIDMRAGMGQPDADQIVVDGQPMSFSITRASEPLGIATIHQEFTPVSALNVAENLVSGGEIHVGAKQAASIDRAATLDVIINLSESRSVVAGCSRKLMNWPSARSNQSVFGPARI